ncbi:MAG: polymer-forming cytoskeletal protein [Hyphomicrobiaceae bacterium]|nr:polymer-forming cytoskeletal protein [Hyphomicrobiaceae bacterium]
MHTSRRPGKRQSSSNHAVIHGEFSGQLKIENFLDVRATGKIAGDLAYGQLAVAMGGHILGRVTNPLTADQVKPGLYVSEVANIA